MADDLVAREMAKQIRQTVDAFINGSPEGGGVNLPGGIRTYASIPRLRAETDNRLGIAICVGGYADFNGNITGWINGGSMLQNTLRLPNNTTIIATAGGLWMVLFFADEAPVDGEVVIVPPGSTTFNVSVPVDYVTYTDFQGSTVTANKVTAPDISGRESSWRKDLTGDTTGTEGISWVTTIGGTHYRNVTP